MFDIGWSELVVIAVVALIAIGPKELPAVLRTVGQYMGKIRRMASEFQGQFQEAMREAEMADLKKSVDEMTDAAKGVTDSFTNYDPLADVKKEVESFSADPLGASAAASGSSISPEAAAPATPSPLSPDAGIEPLAVASTPEAPQPQPEAHSETKPASGSGA
jgi:sec-independent protein translocase protein TatB